MEALSACGGHLIEMHQLGQDLRLLSFPSSENARVLEMTDAGDGPVVNNEDALAGNRKTLSK